MRYVAMRLGVLMLAGTMAVCASVPEAGAMRLGKEACDALKAEEAALVAAGVRDKMQGGPERARSLPAGDLQQIKQLIELEEQIGFRCDRPRIAALKPPLPPPPVAVEGAAAPDGAATEEAEAPPPPQPKAQKKKAKVVPAAGAVQAGAKAEPKAAGPATPPAAKKKKAKSGAEAAAAVAPAAAAEPPAKKGQ